MTILLIILAMFLVALPLTGIIFWGIVWMLDNYVAREYRKLYYGDDEQTKRD